MERTFIGDLRKHIGEKVCVQGFMQTLRDQKKCNLSSCAI